MSSRCVVLIGMMGSGKSVVGRSLAEQIGYQFVDTDKLVEKKTGKRVSQIFREDGETTFRYLEKEVIRDLKGTTSKVISPGGGAVLDPDNFSILQGLGITVYLRATARELYQRIKNDGTRPLMQVADPKGEMAMLLAEREPTYRRAHLVIDTEEISVQEVVEQLIDQLARTTGGDG